MATTFQIQSNVILETTTCGECGVVFAMPAALLQRHREKGSTFHCPNGHPRVYRISDVARLQAEVQRERQLRDQVEAQLRDARKSAAGFKAEITRVKNRIGKGVCPCCQRHFTNLERHMHTKHPDYTKPDGE